MPGKPKSSRSFSTSGVMMPRSSAMIGKSALCAKIFVKSSRPGTSSQWPLTAVFSIAGIDQHAWKPRK